MSGHRGYGSINFETNGAGVNVNGEERSRGGVESAIHVERLEWDHSPRLTELTNLEENEAKTKTNENSLGSNSEIQDVSKKCRVFETPDLLSKSTKKSSAVRSNSFNSDSDADHNGCQDDCLYHRILSQSLRLEEIHKRKQDNTFPKESFHFPEVIQGRPCLMENSAIRKLSRSNSAPCLTRRESFEEWDHVHGGFCYGSTKK